MAEPNSLGLDFDQLTIQDHELASAEPTAPASQRRAASSGRQDPTQNTLPPDTREKKKPYVNTERVKTGGSQRDKLSEEALTQRMARMREQNEKIKQRRLDVQADEEAFRKTQESERIKQAQIRKVQDNVDRTREQNAKRKMDKIHSREWDSGKPTGEWKHKKAIESATSQPAQPSQPIQPTNEGKEEETAASSPSRDSGNWVRGSPRGACPERGRGRVRGRGRGGSSTAQGDDAKSPMTESVPSSNSADTVAHKEETSKDATS